jgi:hypothetical protein
MSLRDDYILRHRINRYVGILVSALALQLILTPCVALAFALATLVVACVLVHYLRH